MQLRVNKCRGWMICLAGFVMAGSIPAADAGHIRMASEYLSRVNYRGSELSYLACAEDGKPFINFSFTWIFQIPCVLFASIRPDPICPHRRDFICVVGRLIS